MDNQANLSSSIQLHRKPLFHVALELWELGLARHFERRWMLHETASETQNRAFLPTICERPQSTSQQNIVDSWPILPVPWLPINFPTRRFAVFVFTGGYCIAQIVVSLRLCCRLRSTKMHSPFLIAMAVDASASASSVSFSWCNIFVLFPSSSLPLLPCSGCHAQHRPANHRVPGERDDSRG